MFRIMPVAKYDYGEFRDLALNMAMVDVIKPSGTHRCELQSDECFWWYVNAPLEEVVEFLSSDCHSFTQWKELMTKG